MDRANAHLDNLLTEHIMSVNKKIDLNINAQPSTKATQTRDQSFVSRSQLSTPAEPDAPLYKRLKYANLVEIDFTNSFYT